MGLMEIMRKALQASWEDAEETQRRAHLEETVKNAVTENDEETLREIVEEHSGTAEGRRMLTDAIRSALQRVLRDYTPQEIADFITTVVHAVKDTEHEDLKEKVYNTIRFVILPSLREPLRGKVRLKLPTDVEDELKLKVQETLEAAGSVDEMVERLRDIVNDYEPPPTVLEGGWDLELTAAVSEVASEVLSAVVRGDIPISEFSRALKELENIVQEVEEMERKATELLKAAILEKLLKAVYGDGTQAQESEEKSSRIKDLVRRIAFRHLRRRAAGTEEKDEIPQETLEEDVVTEEEEEETAAPETEAGRKAEIVRKCLVEGLLSALFATLSDEDVNEELVEQAKTAITEFANRLGVDPEEVSAVYPLI